VFELLSRIAQKIQKQDILLDIWIRGRDVPGLRHAVDQLLREGS